VKLNGKTITDLAHQVRGCALCQASASVIAEAVIGRELAAAREGRDALQSLLTGTEPAAPWQGLGIFAPVRKHKSRHDCVRLPFDALDRALAEATKR
jgi:nitrogen fixation NifU-like protein